MRTIAAVIAVAASVLAGCGQEQQDSVATPPETTGVPTSTTTLAATTAPNTTTAPKTTTATGTAVKIGGSPYGEMLFAVNDQAIYLFDEEKTSKPECYGACAKAWPPVLTDGRPRAVKGVDAAMLGTVKRTDGTTQVTYNDHPLYFYADEAPGEVKCHNVDHAGGLWYVVQPNGDEIGRAHV